MDIEFIKAFQKIEGQDVYIFADVLDFTNENSNPKVVVKSNGIGFEIPIPKNRKELYYFCGAIQNILCNPNILVISWDIKNFISYVLAKTGKPMPFGKVLDLKILEFYLGTSENLKPPETFAEAHARLKAIVTDKNWEELRPIYTRVYHPLITKVIPDIETVGLIHRRRQKRVFSHYDIAGQINGRMKCSESLQESFNPHSMGKDEKKHSNPPNADEVLICLDYKHMEVSVLQWLSGDPLLGKILDSGEDCYKGIWKELTSLEGTDQSRRMCKEFFLPVMFGMGARSLSEKIGIHHDVAVKLHDRIYSKFSVATSWLAKQKELVKNDIAEDIFGRRRTIPLTEQYKIRNFVIQSPAALFCLSKLVQLHKALPQGKARLGFHIHDGYVLYTRKNERQQMAKLAIDVLEREDSLFPNLKLKVSCETGTNLIDLIKEEHERNN